MTQKDALDILKMGHNVFLTGAAGSGKTFVLNQYISYLKQSGVEVAITASTGIASTHINGMTIHAWSGLGIKNSLSDHDLEAMMDKQYLFKRFEKTQVLVIDEISMLSGRQLTMVEWICRTFKRNDRPFGGLQVILCGDFFQLPPITRFGDSVEEGRSKNDFAYESDVWKFAQFTICYLSEQHRQKDNDYLTVLNQIRSNTVSKETIALLQSREHAESDVDVPPTKLYTHNADVDTINHEHLETLTTHTKEFVMSSKGKDFLIEGLKRSCLAPERLRLKEGARVMFVKNNYEVGFVNGTLGVITGFNTFGEPLVRTVGGRLISVTKMSWSIEEEGKVKAEITQLPLRLAWAITVHKSQGMSLDAMEVDLRKSFVKGMGYVALSRVRSLGGMKLLGFNPLSLEVDPDVLEFDQNLKELSFDAVEDLRNMSLGERGKIQEEFLFRVAPPKEQKEKKEPKKSAREITREMLAEGMSLGEVADVRGVKQDTIVSHIEELVEDGIDIDIDHLKKEFAYKELDTIIDAFDTCDTTTLSPVYNYLSKLKKKPTYLKLRIARLFL
ncbi:MAG: AAA family ATPase [Candidatus Zambryskibacteria bacterium]|nr:AAA family ATPase [Candidatus Zambryskibacteria bacterium]